MHPHRVTGLQLGRLLRLTRMRKEWRLTDLAARTGLSAATLGRHERGRAVSMDRLRQHAAAFELRVEFSVSGRSAEVPRLRDDEHAAIASGVAGVFAADGWQVQPEASYNEWGERGRIDLLAHRPHRTDPILAVIEVKTDIGDLQALLGSLNVQQRLAPAVARRLGWGSPRMVTILAVAATSRNRNLVSSHLPLFATFRRSALRRHVPALGATDHLLLWVPPSAAERTRWLAGRRRVRRPASHTGRRPAAS